MPRQLTPKQATFVREYLIDLNASAAATRAGYSAKNADKLGWELLGHSRVSAAIAEHQAERFRRLDLTADTVLQEAARVAFADLRKLFDSNGRPKPLAEWEPQMAAAVASIEVAETYDREWAVVGRVTKIKLWPKMDALTLLAKHLQLFVDRVAHEDADGKPVGTALAQALTVALARAYGEKTHAQATP